MDNTIVKQLIKKNTEMFECVICQRIAFPPVKWNISTVQCESTPKCNHMYCLKCTRIYFQLDKKVNDRHGIRYECCACQQPLSSGSCINGYPKNAKDVYYHCNNDEYTIVELLTKLDGEKRQCEEGKCTFETTDPYKMRVHMRDECEYNELNCKYRKYGCNFKGLRSFLVAHEGCCTFKPTRCMLCNCVIKMADKVYHLNSYHHVTMTHKIDNSVIFDDSTTAPLTPLVVRAATNPNISGGSYFGGSYANSNVQAGTHVHNGNYYNN